MVFPRIIRIFWWIEQMKIPKKIWIDFLFDFEFWIIFIKNPINEWQQLWKSVKTMVNYILYFSFNKIHLDICIYVWQKKIYVYIYSIYVWQKRYMCIYIYIKFISVNILKRCTLAYGSCWFDEWTNLFLI